jgi:(p)ppGpp synthase/HD superfamily hydrolase
MDEGTRPTAPEPGTRLLGERFQEALRYATELHATQVRKGTTIPYVSHLISACALVLENGGNEDEAIAALLHDAVEDQGGAPILAEIERRFGGSVARIVAGCTDSDTVGEKPPWRPRKEAYIAHLREAPRSVQRVSAADKLHNARSIVADLHRTGPALFSRFTGGREGTLWYYETLSAVFASSGIGFLADELRRTVAEMKRLAG